MPERFDHTDYRTRYAPGTFPEEGEEVFQHRTAPVVEADLPDGRSFGRSAAHRAKSPGRLRPFNPRSKRALRAGSALGALLLLLYLGSKAYQVYLLSPEQLYAESYQPYVLRAPAATDTGWSRFEIFYRQGAMDSIIRAARRKVILSEKETLIAGLAYLVADDPFWAIRQLKKIGGRPKNSFLPEADFYLALAYLKNRDYDHALTTMLQIRRQPQHPYRDKFSDDFIDRVKLLKWR